jgi:hypothetical protein
VILYCALTFDEPLMYRYRTIATLFIPVLVIFLIIRVYRDIKVCRVISDFYNTRVTTIKIPEI